jgi:hypothetical protein
MDAREMEMFALIHVYQELIEDYAKAITMKPIFSIERDPGTNTWTFRLNATKREDMCMLITEIRHENLDDPRPEMYAGEEIGTHKNVMYIIRGLSNVIDRITITAHYVELHPDKRGSPITGHLDTGKIIIQSRSVNNSFASALNQVDIDHLTSIGLTNFRSA